MAIVVEEPVAAGSIRPRQELEPEVMVDGGRRHAGHADELADGKTAACNHLNAPVARSI